VLIFGEKIERITTFAAAKTLEYVFDRGNTERGCFFVVKGAKAY